MSNSDIESFRHGERKTSRLPTFFFPYAMDQAVTVTIQRDGVVTEMKIDRLSGSILSTQPVPVIATWVPTPVHARVTSLTRTPTPHAARLAGAAITPAPVVPKATGCSACAKSAAARMKQVFPANPWSTHQTTHQMTALKGRGIAGRSAPQSTPIVQQTVKPVEPMGKIGTSKALELAIAQESAAAKTPGAVEELKIKAKSVDDWAKATWHMMVVQAHFYSETPSEDERRDKHNFFKSMLRVTPCPTCKYDSMGWEKNHPLSEAVRSRSSLLKWVIDHHNHVTEKKGSGNIWKLEDTLRIYGLGG